MSRCSEYINLTSFIGPTAVRDLRVSVSSASSVVVSWREPAETGATIAKYEVDLRKYVLTDMGEDEAVPQQKYSIEAQERSLSIISLSQYSCSLFITVHEYLSLWYWHGLSC